MEQTKAVADEHPEEQEERRQSATDGQRHLFDDIYHSVEND